MTALEQILRLSVAERVKALEVIWKSLPKQSIAPTEAHASELEHRLAKFERGDMEFSSWEDVRKRIQSHL